MMFQTLPIRVRQMSPTDYATLQRQLIASAAKQGVGHHDAEDLVQDTLVVTSSKYGWENSAFDRLAFGVLRNHCRRFRSQIATRPQCRDLGEFVGTSTASLRPSSVSGFGRDDLSELIDEQLPPRQAKVIHLRLRGHSQRAIARILTMSLGTVASICRRAPQRLSRSNKNAELEHRTAG